ncbi:hypothetical protein F5B20DRAFT_575585 [Whalleya microplaca]|nr:hypothetical protein F5B20DRAFT_575585 [Whalleya microplaca]
MWAGYLGVFADEKAELNTRLRYSPDIRDLVVQLLNLLNRNLEDRMQSQDIAIEPERRTIDSSLGHNESKKRVLYQAFDPVGEAVDRLHRLAISIRRSSIPEMQSRVSRFARRDNDDDGLEELALTIIKWEFSGINEPLAQQLAASVCYRRQRLLYQRRHQQELRFHRKPHPTIIPMPDRLNLGPITTPLPVLSGEARMESSEPGGSKLLSETVLSAIDAQNVWEDHTGSSNESAISGPTSVSPTFYQKYPCPSPPKAENGATYGACNWCFETHAMKNFENKRWWRTHFNQDLQPYVCISEDCAEPPKYFKGYKAWEIHMRDAHTPEWAREIHKIRKWYCDISHPQREEFPSANELEEHIRGAHSGNFTGRKLSSIVKRNVVFLSRSSALCPICQFIPEELLRVLPGNNSPRIASPVIHPTGSKDKETDVGFDVPRIKTPPEHPKSSFSNTEEESSIEHLDRDPLSSLDSEEASNSRIIRTMLAKHIAEHSKVMAFISIRYLDDESIAFMQSQQASADTAKGDSNDDEHIASDSGLSSISLNFEDAPPEERGPIQVESSYHDYDHSATQEASPIDDTLDFTKCNENVSSSSLNQRNTTAALGATLDREDTNISLKSEKNSKLTDKIKRPDGMVMQAAMRDLKVILSHCLGLLVSNVAKLQYLQEAFPSVQELTVVLSHLETQVQDKSRDIQRMTSLALWLNVDLLSSLREDGAATEMILGPHLQEASLWFSAATEGHQRRLYDNLRGVDNLLHRDSFLQFLTEIQPE